MQFSTHGVSVYDRFIQDYLFKDICKAKALEEKALFVKEKPLPTSAPSPWNLWGMGAKANLQLILTLCYDL